MPLTIGIKFLTGYYAAARSKSEPEPEWPPHPARVFMSLTAAHFESDADAAEGEALAWLERLDAPHLCVPASATSSRAISVFVPVNDNSPSGKGNAIPSIPSMKRWPASRLFPRTHVPEDDDTMFVIWANVTPAELEQHKKGIKLLCSKVGRLGHSTSFVQMWAMFEMPPKKPNYFPSDRGDMLLRSITPGLIARLTSSFDLNKRPIIGQSQRYSLLQNPFAISVGSCFDPKIFIFCLKPKNSDFKTLDIAGTLHLTKSLREAVLSNTPEPIPECISGHQFDGSPTQKTHIAFFPIPFVRDSFGDGHLLGFGVALPRDIESSHEKALIAALGLLVQNGLKLGRLGEWEVIEEIEVRARGAMLRSDTWTASVATGCRRWATVTPIVFDQHPKAKTRAAYLEETAELVGRACANIGLPKPASVRPGSVSVFTGSPPSHAFPRLKRKDGSERRQTHAIIEFDVPIVGPILLCAGRYRGYGLLKPLPEKEGT